MAAQTSNALSFERDLQALWSAEKMLTEAMPLVIEKATNLGLKKNLALHLAETDQHKIAIEGICRQLGYQYEGDENEEIKNILSEGQQAMNAQTTADQIDAAVIAGAIQIEHYEIDRYEAVTGTARALGYDGIASRLALTLEEERQADVKLNFLDKTLVQKTSVAGMPNLALK